MSVATIKDPGPKLTRENNRLPMVWVPKAEAEAMEKLNEAARKHPWVWGTAEEREVLRKAFDKDRRNLTLTASAEMIEMCDAAKEPLAVKDPEAVNPGLLELLNRGNQITYKQPSIEEAEAIFQAMIKQRELDHKYNKTFRPVFSAQAESTADLMQQLIEFQVKGVRSVTKVIEIGYNLILITLAACLVFSSEVILEYEVLQGLLAIGYFVAWYLFIPWLRDKRDQKIRELRGEE